MTESQLRESLKPINSTNSYHRVNSDKETGICDSCEEKTTVLTMKTKLSVREGIYGAQLCGNCRRSIFYTSRHNYSKSLYTKEEVLAAIELSGITPEDIREW